MLAVALLYASPLFATPLAGYNNTYFIFNSNPPTGTMVIKAGDPKGLASRL
jgi:hypothetical protein